MRFSFTWATAVLLVSAAVLACTLFPFTFTHYPLGSISNLFSLRIGPELGPDILENTLLFLPLGFALAGHLDRKRIRRWVVMISILVASFALSYSVETLQLFVPGRISSLTDVLANTAGGGLGFLCYSLRTETGLLGVVAYLVPAVLVAVPLQWSTTLRDWEPHFPLIVGNERTGDRPWHGRVFDVMIIDRALSGREVADLSHGRPASPRIAESIVASYELTAPGGLDDKAGRLPPLAWRPSPPPHSAGGAAVGHRWLETTGPATALITRAKQRSAFTLLVTAATADTRQDGPARIVSLSGDPGRRNFTLGQSQSELVFRLRTPLTGENGYRPELVVPGVFSTHARQHVAVTYDGVDLLTYVDGVRSAHGMRLGLGAAAFAPLLDRFPRASYAYSVLFYALLFVPAGMLLSRAATPAARLRPWIFVGASIVGCSLGFDALLVGVSGRPFNWSNVFWAATFSTFAAVAYQLHVHRCIRQRWSAMRLVAGMLHSL